MFLKIEEKKKRIQCFDNSKRCVVFSRTKPSAIKFYPVKKFSEIHPYVQRDVNALEKIVKLLLINGK